MFHHVKETLRFLMTREALSTERKAEIDSATIPDENGLISWNDEQIIKSGKKKANNKHI